MIRKRPKGRFARFLRDERGATAMEYGLIIFVVTLGLVWAVQGTTGEKLIGVFTTMADAFNTDEIAAVEGAEAE